MGNAMYKLPSIFSHNHSCNFMDEHPHALKLDIIEHFIGIYESPHGGAPGEFIRCFDPQFQDAMNQPPKGIPFFEKHAEIKHINTCAAIDWGAFSRFASSTNKVVNALQETGRAAMRVNWELRGYRRDSENNSV